jgi:hypothetical protein
MLSSVAVVTLQYLFDMVAIAYSSLMCVQVFLVTYWPLAENLTMLATCRYVVDSRRVNWWSRGDRTPDLRIATRCSACCPHKEPNPS